MSRPGIHHRFMQTTCKIDWWVGRRLGNGRLVFSKAPNQYDGRTLKQPQLLHKGRKP